MSAHPPGTPLGYLGVTDGDWFRFLRSQKDLDEVNFWQPSGGRVLRVLPAGGPFFFKLKSPVNAIGGFGYFVGSSRVPLLYAWDAFEQRNGAASLADLVCLIRKHRHDSNAQPAELQIGCLMIADPVFFDDDELVAQPRDWHRNVVSGMTMSLAEGEGARIWRDCQARLAARRTRIGSRERATGSTLELPSTSPPLPVRAFPTDSDDRYGSPIEVRPRRGQGSFRVTVLDAYNRQCAVTTEHSLPVLEAAHIRPYSKEGTHEPSNGILFRSDIHRLFDLGYVGVDTKYRFQVSPKLRESWDNGRAYYELRNREILLPNSVERRPDRKQLEWHMEEVFLR